VAIRLRYDISVAPPSSLLQSLQRSYANIFSNRCIQGALGAGFVSSEEGAFRRL